MGDLIVKVGVFRFLLPKPNSLNQYAELKDFQAQLFESDAGFGYR